MAFFGTNKKDNKQTLSYRWAMFGISIRDRIRNAEIRRKLKTNQRAQESGTTQLETGHIAKQDSTKCTNKLVRWHSRDTPKETWEDLKEGRETTSMRSQGDPGFKLPKVERHGKVWNRPTFKTG